MNVDGTGGYTVGVWPTAVGLFTANVTGAGQLDARNEDGSANSSTSPAQAGSVVELVDDGSRSDVAGLERWRAWRGGAALFDSGAIHLCLGQWCRRRCCAGDPGAGAGGWDCPSRHNGPDRYGTGDAVVRINVSNSDPASFSWQPRTTIVVQWCRQKHPVACLKSQRLNRSAARPWCSTINAAR